MDGFYIGPVTCPHCDAFVDMDTRFCPYCHQSTAGAPWRTRWTKTSAVITGVLLLGWVADWYFGWGIVEALKQDAGHS